MGWHRIPASVFRGQNRPPALVHPNSWLVILLAKTDKGAATAKLVADATILNSVPGPASSGYAVFALSSGDVPSTVLLRTDFPYARQEIQMHARADASSDQAASWPEDIFAILQRFDVRQVPYVPDAGHSQ